MGERRKRSPGDLEIFLHFDALRWSLLLRFLPRDAPMHVVLARYCYRKSSVRPSVRLSVCLSVCNVAVR